MLSQQAKKDIKEILNFIYKKKPLVKSIDVYAEEIFRIIKKYNSKGNKEKK